MTFGSLFSGIGGLDLGLERAGMECRWQCEIEPFCRQVLAKHWPHVTRYKDVREIGEELEPVDLICGGYPCQPFSQVGERGGTEDPRHLWPEFARILRLLRPRYALMENVPGHLSMGFGDVLGDLAEIGFDAEWMCLRASDFGAPHRRKRVFILAYSRSERSQGQLQAGTAAMPVGRGCGEPSRMGEVPVLRGVPMPDPSDPCFGVRVPTDRGMAIRPLHGSGWWEIGPGVLRVANGIPRRMDRLRGIGNAVVPQVAEWIGRRIMEAA
jgi:DNA (cytosine-5)-methyltransferase 1